MEPTSQLKIAEEAAKELGITQLVPAVYQDVLQPAAKEAGQQLVTVAKAVGVALAPLQVAVWGYQAIKDYLGPKVTARLAKKPAEEIKAPDRIIAGPVVMGMAFAAEAPHLKEMYANLLASSMHSPTAKRVHPSFVQIIQQLSPDEAKILKWVATEHKGGSILFHEDLATLENQPEAGMFGGMGALFWGKTDITFSWKHLCGQYGVADAVLAEAFYRNLMRLGILAERIEGPQGKIPPISWAELQRCSPTNRLSRCVELTAYGDLFLDVFVRDL